MLNTMAIGEVFYQIKENDQLSFNYYENSIFHIVKCKLVGKIIIEPKIYGITLTEKNYTSSYFFKEYRDDGSMSEVLEYQGNPVFKTLKHAKEHIYNRS